MEYIETARAVGHLAAKHKSPIAGWSWNLLLALIDYTQNYKVPIPVSVVYAELLAQEHVFFDMRRCELNVSCSCESPYGSVVILDDQWLNLSQRASLNIYYVASNGFVVFFIAGGKHQC